MCSCTKKQFLPPEISASEPSEEVQLQELLNKTAESIVKIANISVDIKLKLTSKRGFDGSAGHSTYKQKFLEAHNATDEFCLSVLWYVHFTVNNNKNIIIV